MIQVNLLIPTIIIAVAQLTLLCLCIQADAYIRVKLGRREISDKENYIPNELNPIFGKYVRMFV